MLVPSDEVVDTHHGPGARLEVDSARAILKLARGIPSPTCFSGLNGTNSMATVDSTAPAPLRTTQVGNALKSYFATEASVVT